MVLAGGRGQGRDSRAVLAEGARWLRAHGRPVTSPLALRAELEAEERAAATLFDEGPAFELGHGGGPVSTRATLEMGREWIRRYGSGPRPGLRRIPDPRTPPRATLAQLRAALDEEERTVGARLRREERKEMEDRLGRLVMSPEREALREIAFHEAGHAVVAHLEGAGIQHIAVRVREAEAFESRRAGDLRVHGGTFRAVRSDRCSSRMDLAGIEAMILAGVPEDRALLASEGDRRRAARGRHATGVESQDRAAARALLRQHWSSVRAIADALMRWGELDGSEAEEMIRKARGRAA